MVAKELMMGLGMMRELKDLELLVPDKTGAGAASVSCTLTAGICGGGFVTSWMVC